MVSISSKDYEVVVVNHAGVAVTSGRHFIRNVLARTVWGSRSSHVGRVGSADGSSEFIFLFHLRVVLVEAGILVILDEVRVVHGSRLGGLQLISIRQELVQVLGLHHLRHLVVAHWRRSCCCLCCFHSYQKMSNNRDLPFFLVLVLFMPVERFASSMPSSFLVELT